MTVVSVHVDVRERALIEALEGASFAFEQRQLLLGDVELQVDGERALVIERKTLADLAASVKDGRYREQRARLLANVPRDQVVYVIEGSYGFSFDSARMRGNVGGLPPAIIQGCVMSMLLREGVRVVLTRDTGDSAAFVARVAERYAKKGVELVEAHAEAHAAAACESAVKAKRGDNVTPAACFRHMLCQIPGVSSALSATLEAEFGGSMAELYRRLGAIEGEAGRVDALAKLPLIGKKKALTLLTFLGLALAGDVQNK